MVENESNGDVLSEATKTNDLLREILEAIRCLALEQSLAQVQPKPLYPFDPDWRIHPGETLREYIENNYDSVFDFSHANIFYEHDVREIVEGKLAINDISAKELERATGIPARIWLVLQQGYDQAGESDKVKAAELRPELDKTRLQRARDFRHAVSRIRKETRMLWRERWDTVANTLDIQYYCSECHGKEYSIVWNVWVTIKNENKSLCDTQFSVIVIDE